MSRGRAAFIIFFVVLFLLDTGLGIYEHNFNDNTLEAIWRAVNAVIDLIMIDLAVSTWEPEDDEEEPVHLTKQDLEDSLRDLERRETKQYPNVRV